MQIEIISKVSNIRLYASQYILPILILKLLADIQTEILNHVIKIVIQIRWVCGHPNADHDPHEITSTCLGEVDGYSTEYCATTSVNTKENKKNMMLN